MCSVYSYFVLRIVCFVYSYMYFVCFLLSPGVSQVKIVEAALGESERPTKRFKHNHVLLQALWGQRVRRSVP